MQAGFVGGTRQSRGPHPDWQSLPNRAMFAVMATMNISLPHPMKNWVEAQAATGRYSNASDYVRDLIRRDQERRAKVDQMQRLVDEARDGGVSDDSMSDIRARALRQSGLES
jgi:antitoxin ParD1/3/4